MVFFGYWNLAKRHPYGEMPTYNLITIGKAMHAQVYDLFSLHCINQPNYVSFLKRADPRSHREMWEWLIHGGYFLDQHHAYFSFASQQSTCHHSSRAIGVISQTAVFLLLHFQNVQEIQLATDPLISRANCMQPHAYFRSACGVHIKLHLNNPFSHHWAQFLQYEWLADRCSPTCSFWDNRFTLSLILWFI